MLVGQSKKRSKYREIGFLKSKSIDHGFNIRFVLDADIDILTQGNTHGGIIALCGERVFENCYNLESIIIPENVTSIEDSAFYGCEKLYEIY